MDGDWIKLGLCRQSFSKSSVFTIIYSTWWYRGCVFKSLFSRPQKPRCRVDERPKRNKTSPVSTLFVWTPCGHRMDDVSVCVSVCVCVCVCVCVPMCVTGRLPSACLSGACDRWRCWSQATVPDTGPGYEHTTGPHKDTQYQCTPLPPLLVAV